MATPDIKAKIKSLAPTRELAFQVTQLYENEDPRIAGNTPTLRKIPVVLLGEKHQDAECLLGTMRKLGDAIGLGQPKTNMLRRNEFLLISEGSDVNPCYRHLRLPTDRIIIEYTPGHSTQCKVTMIDRLILITEMLISVLNGGIKRGTGKTAGQSIPDMVTINEDFFMDRAERDGWWPLLKSMTNGTKIYKQMVDVAFTHKHEEFYQLYNSILSHLINSDYLNDVSTSDDIKHAMSSFIQTRNPLDLKGLSRVFRMSRDVDIIKKVERKAITENSTLKVIVIVFGALHYDHLKTLITDSDALEFDTVRSSNILYGGKNRKNRKNTKKRKKRITKKYNSKSKQGKTRRNQRKNKKNIK
jgi:hypothetical protein